MDAYIHKINLPFIHILPIAFSFKKGIQEVAFVCVCVCVCGGGGGGGGGERHAVTSGANWTE